MTAVYPRWRGEHCRVYARDNKVTGLSPLARGTHRTNLFFPVPVRFIPAGAGNTGGPRPQYRADAVYPRWRGEHGNRLHTLRNESGLSPLARGTHRNAIRSNLTDRFIPAGAGNT
ncbi:hypothetical protein SEEN6807_12445 [Salmonella enterica subsp. enterica serovar Newport str. 36807]|nr:hypothetical protein SEEN6805_08762 [Salmonella enterica subsp. enterica serovar Newport str. 36805]KMT85142.1 hypothetical protein SEEN6807_12445 [Salmonella enterica subsp. enterica serovar Newport str. 36807]